MDRLEHTLVSLFEERMIDENSPLAGAASYMLKRWQGFSEFLRTPGIPLDNNETERLLKAAIRYRKNSGFFKTEKSARLGATIMSILATAAACSANPMDSLPSFKSTSLRLRETRKVSKLSRPIKAYENRVL